MSALLKRLDVTLLFPPFLRVVESVLERCSAQGHSYWGTYGLRTYDQQAALHLAWKQRRGGRAAPAGLSAHQYGLAVDLVADAEDCPGLQPDWCAEAYLVLGKEVARAGLEWGGKFGDSPHVQWPGYVTALQLAPLRQVLVAHGQTKALQAVWTVLEEERHTHAWRTANPRLARRLQLLGCS